MITLIIFGGSFVIGVSWVIHKFFTSNAPKNEKTSVKDKATIQVFGWGILIVLTLVLMGAGLIN